MALGVFATNLKASRETTSAGRYLRDFKATLNTRYRVFLSQFQFPDEANPEKILEQVATITVAMRQFSYKEMGVFSYVFDENEINIADDGSFTDITKLADLERIAQVLHRAEFEAEVANAENLVRMEAEAAGVQVDQNALGLQREAIEKKYFKTKDTDPEKKPLVGSALKYTYTIGIFIPMTAASVPEFEKTQVAIWQLSGARQQKILDLYKAEAYAFSGKPYLEFSFDYSGTTTKEAGQKATFEFIPPNLSLETKFPTEWAQYGKKLMEQLPKGSPEEMATHIVAKCGNLHNRVSIADICSKFYGAISTKQTAVVAIKRLDPDYLKKNKRYIKDLPVLDKYPAIKEFVNNIQEDTVEEAATDVAEDVSTAVPTAAQEAPVPATAEPATPVTPAEPTAPTQNVAVQGVQGSVMFGGLNPNAQGLAEETDILAGM